MICAEGLGYEHLEEEGLKHKQNYSEAQQKLVKATKNIIAYILKREAELQHLIPFYEREFFQENERLQYISDIELNKKAVIHLVKQENLLNLS